MYKVVLDEKGNVACIRRLPDDSLVPLAPANTDYQTFKSEINQDQAELQNADGETMSPEEAKAFVATLP